MLDNRGDLAIAANPRTTFEGVNLQLRTCQVYNADVPWSESHLAKSSEPNRQSNHRGDE